MNPDARIHGRMCYRNVNGAGKNSNLSNEIRLVAVTHVQWLTITFLATVKNVTLPIKEIDMKIHLLRFPEDLRRYKDRIEMANDIKSLISKSESLDMQSAAEEINLEALKMRNEVDELGKQLRALAPIDTTKIIDDPYEPLSPESPGVWNIRAIYPSPETQPMDIENIFSIGIIGEWHIGSSLYEIGFSIYPKIGNKIEYMLRFEGSMRYDREESSRKQRLKEFATVERDRLIQVWTNQKE